MIIDVERYQEAMEYMGKAIASKADMVTHATAFLTKVANTMKTTEKLNPYAEYESVLVLCQHGEEYDTVIEVLRQLEQSKKLLY
jgi:hypothetical protein